MDDISANPLQALMPAASHLQAKDAKEVQTGKDFEALFLTQFVDQMMKTAGSTAFGGKQQADMWRSFMSEEIAKNLVEQGGLGLAGNVSDMLGAYGQASSVTDDKMGGS
jgi:flagellar protein FlgJ